jgi:superfamily II DNA or RNA helicase
MTNKEKSALQKEILDSLPEQPTGRLILAPRSGKTKLIIDLIKRDQPNSILWVTPSSKLADEVIPQEFDKWKAKTYKRRLTTSTYKSLVNIEGTFDIIIFDEDQHITPANVINILKHKTLVGRTMVAMTGTPSDNRIKNQLYDILGISEVLYEISIDKAVEIGLIANYRIKVVYAEMSKAKTMEAGSKTKRFMTSELANYQYLTKMVNNAPPKQQKFRRLNRMRAIKNSPSKTAVAQQILRILGGRRLIFAGTIEQSKKLSQFTFNSKTNDAHLEMFKEGKINSLALVNSGGTGFTYKAIDHLVVVQADSDSNGLTSQKITRTLLDQPDYMATIWIVCLRGTQDENWVSSTLNRFDREKVEFYTFEEFKRVYNGNKP